MRIAMLFGVLVAAGGCVVEELDETTGQLDGRTIVSLTFDDTTADHALAADLVAARGMRATFYVNSSRIDTNGFLSRAQLLAMQAAGHEIAGHTIGHANLTTLDHDGQRREICNDRVALLGQGLAASSFAYPFGASSELTEQAVAACGYNSARGVGGLQCASCAAAEPLPVGDRFDVGTPASIKVDTTLATMQSYILAAEAAGGGWVPLVFHHVCDGCNSLAITPGALGELLDWLAARPGITVQTVHQVVGGSVQPGVAGPPPPAPSSTGNLLVNGSLEADTNSDSVPDCWQRGGTGTNAATFSLTAEAYHGLVAQRLDVTSFTSGSRRLVSRQDLGSCAPAVQAGHLYRVSARYLATVSPRFTIYYRTASGTWAWFAQSPGLPASTSYVLGSYAIPALPADATAISVGLSLTTAGSLTMDAFELVDQAAGAPTAVVGSPVAGTIVTGIAPIVANVTDDVGVTRVRFYLDGTQLGTRTAMPFKWNWNTALTTPGPHAIAIQAEDAAGNATRSATVNVIVQ